MLSSSSFWPLSSACLGSNFFWRASKSRRPSLQPKTAPSILIEPTFVPVIGAGAAAGGLAGAAPAPFDGAVGLPVWASAESVRVVATASIIRRKVLFIVSLELLGTWFRE